MPARATQGYPLCLDARLVHLCRLLSVTPTGWHTDIYGLRKMSLAYASYMYSEVDIASVAALLADRTRVDLVVALSGGVARPAGELASLIGVSPSVTSVHLSRLLAANVVTVEKHGRHRYYRLANPEIISALEPLARMAPLTPVRSLSQHNRLQALRTGRRCYDHLAGVAGVRLTAAMLDNAWIITDNHAWTLTDPGAEAFRGLGIDLQAARQRCRPLLRPCLDWSERRHHLAGSLGAALLTLYIDKGWLRPHPTTRAVAITENGASALTQHFGIQPIVAEAG